ncbi:MAG: D-alanyl-D-alanine carboxypeptidase [Candidatus Obscuribacterales bacterium]
MRKFTALLAITATLAGLGLTPGGSEASARNSGRASSGRSGGTLIASRSKSRKTKSSKSRSRRSKKSRHSRKSRKHTARVPSQFGILVQSGDGDIVMDRLSDTSFNPASAIKLLTAYGAIKTLGPDHRFSTEIYTDGILDESTGVFKGDVILKGHDPVFEKSDALTVSRILSERGIKMIDGKLLVSDRFSLYCSPNALVSGRGLVKILQNAGNSRVAVGGGAQLGQPGENAVLIHEHQSEYLQDTLKVMLSRSLNGAAERIGSVVGGVGTLADLAVNNLGIPRDSLHLDSASGLGQCRITPKQMMLVLLGLEEELKKNGLEFQDILPVAGIDDGTLEKRFTGENERGSVIAKTGTLSHTDGGVSALVGVLRSQQEDLYFVLFNWHGGVNSFRSLQDTMIRQLQEQRGGPRAFDYES